MPQTVFQESIRGVIFDLDGTLYRMQWYLKPVLLWKLLPYHRRLARFLRERDRFAGKVLGSRQELMEAVSGALARVEKSTADQMLAWIDGSFYPAFAAVMRLFRNTRPGLTPLLQRLRGMGLKMAVLSDYGLIAQRLTELGIDPANFDTLASSEAAGALKPSPVPFLDIARTWGIEPASILVVGDREDTDGVAARSAGMPFIRIADPPSSKGSGLCWREVIDVLDSLPTDDRSSYRTTHREPLPTRLL